jgi:hypothetical protein
MKNTDQHTEADIIMARTLQFVRDIGPADNAPEQVRQTWTAWVRMALQGLLALEEQRSQELRKMDELLDCAAGIDWTDPGQCPWADPAQVQATVRRCIEKQGRRAEDDPELVVNMILASKKAMQGSRSPSMGSSMSDTTTRPSAPTGGHKVEQQPHQPAAPSQNRMDGCAPVSVVAVETSAARMRYGQDAMDSSNSSDWYLAGAMVTSQQLESMGQQVTGHGLMRFDTPPWGNSCMLFALLPQLGLMPPPWRNPQAALEIANDWRAAIHARLQSEILAGSELGQRWRSAIFAAGGAAGAAAQAADPDQYLEQYIRGVKGAAFLGELELGVLQDVLLTQRNMSVAIHIFNPTYATTDGKRFRLASDPGNPAKRAYAAIALVPCPPATSQLCHWEAVLPVSDQLVQPFLGMDTPPLRLLAQEWPPPPAPP